jgi:hypothetical protein
MMRPPTFTITGVEDDGWVLAEKSYTEKRGSKERTFVAEGGASLVELLNRRLIALKKERDDD